MIVNTITPTKRQGAGGGAGTLAFKMFGHGFINIDSGSLAWLSANNNNPLEFYGRDLARYKFTIVVLSDSELNILFDETYGYGDFYIGAIGNGVDTPLWVNNTRPL